jgi:hypothetical protein
VNNDRTLEPASDGALWDRALSRRNMLGLLGGAVILAACGGGTTSSATNRTSRGPLALRLSTEHAASLEPQRFAFALWANGKPASGPSASIAFTGPGGRRITETPATLYSTGLPAQRGIYVANPILDATGTWEATIRTQGTTVALPFSVVATGDAPARATQAPRAASPTLAAPLGVNPICTANPPCPLHATSLQDVIGSGKPVAVLFATPARCQSQYCGPVLDELLTLRDKYERAVTLVHVEIYEDMQSTRTSPTVQAWNLPSEPWFFTVDGSGSIVGRLDGAFGRDEMDALLAQLVK